MTKDEEHLNLLSMFHYVVGGLTILGSCVFLIHVGMGIAMLSGALDDGKEAPPRAVGWLFVGLGSAAILIGWTIGILMIIAGRKLCRRVSRTFCLVQPLGTILGIFTLIVLTRDSVTKLFAENGQQITQQLP